ncbi:MAG: cysteine desulfurase [Lysobacterales bacterium]|jgi:cysteine desulfurase/selenocysteine lyase
MIGEGASESAVAALDVERVRADFPILQREVHGKPLVYFDTAASAQRPLAVIAAVEGFYRNFNANIHRGVHTLSQEATEAHEQARAKIANFINAPSASECVFTRGTTEAINLVAHSFGRPLLKEGDEILISYMEHHSNIVPWQLLCEETGATLKVAPINERGELEMDALAGMLNERVKLLGIVHISNALGTVNPVADICALAKQHGVPVLVDGAQAMPHQAVDVQALGCDFYCLSGHKMYGPTGIGVLWGRAEHLEKMRPYQGGGEMISRVTFEKSEYNEHPGKFEAGTPNIAGAIGLGAAVDYLTNLGMDNVAAWEAQLLEYGTERLSQVEGFRMIGTAARKAGVMSFVLGDIHANDVGTIVDLHGVAIRTGHHCAMPVQDFFGVPATARASLGIYNTFEEIDTLAEALEKTRLMFG